MLAVSRVAEAWPNGDFSVKIRVFHSVENVTVKA
jgi:hypothetical protein